METFGKKIKQVVVDYRKWLKGDDNGYLLDHGKMCCLGFECIARGISKDAILGCLMPSDIEYAQLLGIDDLRRCRRAR